MPTRHLDDLPTLTTHAPLRRSVWRRVELCALVATIPAFYLALLQEWPFVARAVYALAAAASLVVLRHEVGPSRRGARRLGTLLTLGLVLSAALPGGDGAWVLGVRGVTAALIVARAGESVRPWFWRGGVPYLLLLAAGTMALCGLGFWWLEPQVHGFGDGLWLAFTTAATVGYGDIVPTSPAAKVFSVFVVLGGVSVLSLLTAAIAATWIQDEDRQMERDLLHDLHAELAAVRADLAALRAEVARVEPPASRH